MTNPRFCVLVVGAGAIGARYDTPDSPYVLTHAHGFCAHPGFRLAGFVDTDGARAREAARLWGGRSFGNLEEAFRAEQVDIVSIAVPDELHFDFLMQVAALPVRAVFTEKPLTTRLNDARTILEQYAVCRIPVCVNYRRSFVPEFEVLRESVQKQAFGKYLTGAGYYGKGLLHNGSHLIHLLCSLFGDVVGHTIVAAENDFSVDDPTISATLLFDGGKGFNLRHVSSSRFVLFEVDLIFDAGRVRITDTGFRIEYHAPVAHEAFKDFRFLTKGKDVETSLGRSLHYSASNIYNHLTLGEPLKCGLAEAFRTMMICDRIRSSVVGTA